MNIKLFNIGGKVKPLAREFKTPKYKRRLAYLESTGTQWIDAKHPSSPCVVPFEIGVFGLDTKWFCGGGTSSTLGFGVCHKELPRDTTTSIGFGWDKTINYWNRVYVKPYYTVGVVMAGSIYLYAYNNVGGNGVTSGSYQESFVLFGRRVGEIIETSKARIFFQIYGDQKLIPVMDFNDVPCMFDEVSGQFFYNQGTGRFLYGELEG